MENLDKLYSELQKSGINVQRDVLMSKYTSFKIGGSADLMSFPRNEEEIVKIINLCNAENIKFLTIGNGSNMIVSDLGISGMVINMSELTDNLKLIDDTTIFCSAGILLSKLCKFALENSLTGLEFAYGIPGSAGGAAYMNAGAYGGEMKDVLVRCTHITPDGKLGELCGEELELDYRTSAYESNSFIITSLTLNLKKGNRDEIKDKMNELLGKRKDKQPLEFPSAGSTFKRPQGYFAGALIEECGLKGYRVGGAQVSEKHAGFVINNSGATAEDVFALIKDVQKIVLKKTGIKLETEIRLVGR